MTDSPRICTRCVMDETVPNITFDAQGVCSYCTEMLARSHRVIFQTPEQRAEKLKALVAEVKAAGQGQQYDCIVGLSGGVDSSFALVQAVELGLRPLAVHMDNGWNSELAQHNIEQLVKGLGVDLYTHVIDWPEYRKLMQAFFDADVVDVELLYDNAMLAVNFQQAARHGVKHMLSGWNQATEGMLMPEGWNWFKKDRRNIYALWRKFGDGSAVRTFPAIGTVQYLYYVYLRGIKWVSFLDFFEYDKQKSLALLKDRFGYKPYLYKHYESVFTRFYQGYLLPKKFGIDKRKIHLGTLVVSGQMTRDAALAVLKEPSAYPSPEALAEDIAYFIKKMGWTSKQLEEYLARPEKPHDMYGSEKPLWELVVAVGKRVLKAPG